MDKIRSSPTSSPQVSIQAQQKSDSAEASKSTQSSLRQLPNEVQDAIFRLLDRKSALAFSATCKHYDANFQNDANIWFPYTANMLPSPSIIFFRAPGNFLSRKQSKRPTWREVYLIETFFERTISKILGVSQMAHEGKFVESAGVIVSVLRSLDKKDDRDFPEIAECLLHWSVKLAAHLEYACKENDAEQLMLATTAFFSKPDHVLSQEIWATEMDVRLIQAQMQANDNNSRAMNHAVENAEFFALKAGQRIPQKKLLAIADTCLTESLSRIDAKGPEDALKNLDSFFTISSKIKDPVSNKIRQQIASRCIDKAKLQVGNLDDPFCAKDVIDVMTAVVIGYLLQPPSQIKDDRDFPETTECLLHWSVKLAEHLEDAHQENDAEQLMLATTAFFSKPDHVLYQEVWLAAMDVRLAYARMQADYNSRAMNHAVENAEFFALKAGQLIPQRKLLAIADIFLTESLRRIDEKGPEDALKTLDSFFRISSKIKASVSDEIRQQIASRCIDKAKRQVANLEDPLCAKDAITSVVIAYLLQPSSQINFDAHLNGVENAFSVARTRARCSGPFFDYDYERKSIDEEIVKLTADGIKQSLQELCASNPIVASLARLLGYFDPLLS